MPRCDLDADGAPTPRWWRHGNHGQATPGAWASRRTRGPRPLLHQQGPQALKTANAAQPVAKSGRRLSGRGAREILHRTSRCGVPRDWFQGHGFRADDGSKRSRPLFPASAAMHPPRDALLQLYHRSLQQRLSDDTDGRYGQVQVPLQAIDQPHAHDPALPWLRPLPVYRACLEGARPGDTSHVPFHAPQRVRLPGVVWTAQCTRPLG